MSSIPAEYDDFEEMLDRISEMTGPFGYVSHEIGYVVLHLPPILDDDGQAIAGTDFSHFFIDDLEAYPEFLSTLIQALKQDLIASGFGFNHTYSPEGARHEISVHHPEPGQPAALFQHAEEPAVWCAAWLATAESFQLAGDEVLDARLAAQLDAAKMLAERMEALARDSDATGLPEDVSAPLYIELDEILALTHPEHHSLLRHAHRRGFRFGPDEDEAEEYLDSGEADLFQIYPSDLEDYLELGLPIPWMLSIAGVSVESRAIRFTQVGTEVVFAEIDDDADAREERLRIFADLDLEPEGTGFDELMVTQHDSSDANVAAFMRFLDLYRASAEAASAGFDSESDDEMELEISLSEALQFALPAWHGLIRHAASLGARLAADPGDATETRLFIFPPGFSGSYTESPDWEVAVPAADLLDIESAIIRFDPDLLLSNYELDPVAREEQVGVYRDLVFGPDAPKGRGSAIQEREPTAANIELLKRYISWYVNYVMDTPLGGLRA